MRYFRKGKHRRNRNNRYQHVTMTNTIILDTVAVILEEMCGIDSGLVTPEKRFKRDLDIDDLSMVEVIVRCEDAFDMARTHLRVLDSLKTVQDLINYIIIYQDSLIRRSSLPPAR